MRLYSPSEPKASSWRMAICLQVVHSLQTFVSLKNGYQTITKILSSLTPEETSLC